ncbi:MAG: hypothetical protein JXE06_02830 [Coriobacteriia bacterium]|nr:hypothetical protein [Coriobacteriia bacterium]
MGSWYKGAYIPDPKPGAWRIYWGGGLIFLGLISGPPGLLLFSLPGVALLVSGLKASGG